MLKKLIKYDLLADYKRYGIVFAAMLMFSLLLMALDRLTEMFKENRFFEIMMVTCSILFFAAFVVMCTMVMVLATIRFYKNLVRDEGYLMHTLPVPVWQLITSKFITMYIWSAAAVVVTGICFGIVSGEPLWMFKLGEVWEELSIAFVEDTVTGTAEQLRNIFLACFIVMLLSPGFMMLHIYMSLALGNLFNVHKLGMSVLMFFALYIGEQLLSGVAMLFMSADMVEFMLDVNAELDFVNGYGFMMPSLIFSIVYTVVLMIVFFIGSERIFSKKLNLE
ncbi:MAG: hypothetical protein IJ035_05605 [Oscillospiraceae bacterium]|nr:hypothetical protein [Oscillospiraceae bacterium]